MLASRTIDPEGVRILARSFYRELREGGCSPKQILAASNEILDLVTKDLREKPQALPNGAEASNGTAAG